MAVSLPFEGGQIQDSYLPKPAAPPPFFIFHLQTAHAHYQSANQIQKIIKNLQEKYKIDLIFVEGANHSLEPRYLQFFTDPALNNQMLNRLAQKGELTGVDLALASSKGFSTRFIGIENSSLYRHSYQIFKRVIRNVHQMDPEIEKRKLILDQKASRLFSSGARKLLSKWETFQNGQSNLIPTAQFLEVQFLQLTKLNLMDSHSQFQWPQLVRFLRLVQLEKQINFKQLRGERHGLQIWLQKRGLSRKLSQNLFLPAKENPRESLENWIKQTQAFGFHFEDYPQLSLFLSAHIFKKELDGAALYKETDRLFNQLLDLNLKSQQERNLLKAYKELFLFKKLAHLELSPSDWQKIKNDGNAFSSLTLSPQGKELGEGLKLALKFYRLSEAREKYFLKTIYNKMETLGGRQAILVTGGFHTTGMGHLFKEKGVGYVQITPKLTETESSKLYYEIMLRTAHLEKPPFPASAFETKSLLGTQKESRDYFQSEFNRIAETFKEIAKENHVSPKSFQTTFYSRNRESFLHPRSELRSEDDSSLEKNEKLDKAWRVARYLQKLFSDRFLDYFADHTKFRFSFDFESGWKKENRLRIYPAKKGRPIPIYYAQLNREILPRGSNFISRFFSNNWSQELSATFHFVFSITNEKLSLQVYSLQNGQPIGPLSLSDLTASLGLADLSKSQQESFQSMIYSLSSEPAAVTDPDKYEGGVSVKDLPESRLKVLEVKNAERISHILGLLRGLHEGVPVPAITYFGSEDALGNPWLTFFFPKVFANWGAGALHEGLAQYFIQINPSSDSEIQNLPRVWTKNKRGEIIELYGSGRLQVLADLRSHKVQTFVAMDKKAFDVNNPQAYAQQVKPLIQFLERYHLQPSLSAYLLSGPSGAENEKTSALSQYLQDQLRQITHRSELRKDQSIVQSAERQAKKNSRINFAMRYALRPMQHSGINLPLQFSTALNGTQGIGSINWDEKTLKLYQAFLDNSSHKARTVNSLKAAENLALSDRAKDGTGIPGRTKEKASETPVLLQVDLNAFTADDEEGLKMRLRDLPKGSAVIVYTEQNSSQSTDMIARIISRLPIGKLHYFRKTFVNHIRLEEAVEELSKRSTQLGIPVEHAAFLFSSSNLSQFSDKDLSKTAEALGITFQIDAAKLKKQYPDLKGISAALLGEMAEFAKLDKDLRDKILSENQGRGLFGFSGGIYSLAFESWLEARQALSASA